MLDLKPGDLHYSCPFILTSPLSCVLLSFRYYKEMIAERGNNLCDATHSCVQCSAQLWQLRSKRDFFCAYSVLTNVRVRKGVLNSLA